MLFPDSVTELQSGVLRDCTALTQCRLPAGIRELPDHMFMGCTALTDAALSESLETIRDHAFFECKSLPRAVLPQGVRAVGDHAFSHCERLTEFTVPVQCAAFGLYVLTWCDRIRVIRLHPDDPALYRDYSTVRRLDADLFSVLCMIRQHDYDKPADVTVKYPLLILHALRTQEPELNAYIRKHCTEMMAECIPAGDVCFVRALAQSADYFTAQNIDGLIALAQESDQQEIVMILLNYKNAHFGFGQTGARRL